MTNVTIDDNSNNHFYNEYLNKLNKNKKICQLAAEYYEKNYNLLNIPTILLTSLTGIGSFCNTSELISNENKLYLSLIIGIIGSLSSLLQSFNTSLKFNTKSEMFRNAADQYEILITKINFESNFPNENDFVNKMEKKILTIQNNCKYFPPSFIIDKVEKL